MGRFTANGLDEGLNEDAGPVGLSIFMLLSA
jgi:hypothetical protein